MPSSYIPPEPVARAAARGLELRKGLPPSRQCCTSVGLRRAAQLANRLPVSVATLTRMVSFFDRHSVDKLAASWEDPRSKGRQAWLCWGGDPGRAWARRTLRELERSKFWMQKLRLHGLSD